MPVITVKGMHCGNCQKAVAEAISKVPGVSGVVVDLQKGQASWQDADPASPADVGIVKQAVNDIGFEAP